MTRFDARTDRVTLKMGLILTPIIFIAAVVLFWIMGRTFGWPSNDEQRTLAVYIALGTSLLPLAAYALGFLSQKRAAVGVKLFGTDFTLTFGTASSVVRPLPVPENILIPGTYQSLTHSGSEEVTRAIRRASSAPIVTVDIKNGRAWWLSRLFALSAGAVRFGAPDAIVFLSTQETVQESFLGWAEPKHVFETITRGYPEYEQCYMTSKAIFAQLALSPLDTSQTDLALPIKLSPKVENYRYTYASGKEYAFLQILLDRLRVLEPPDKEPIWLTTSFLTDSFGYVWHRRAVNIKLPEEQQLEALLDVRANYVPLTQEGQFIGMMPSQLALTAAVKQLRSLVSPSAHAREG